MTANAAVTRGPAGAVDLECLVPPTRSGGEALRLSATFPLAAERPEGTSVYMNGDASSLSCKVNELR